jgi:hypothetical protein
MISSKARSSSLIVQITFTNSSDHKNNLQEKLAIDKED